MYHSSHSGFGAESGRFPRSPASFPAGRTGGGGVSVRNLHVRGSSLTCRGIPATVPGVGVAVRSHFVQLMSTSRNVRPKIES